MSLARTLLNGGFIGTADINPARYGHECGASQIAMESIEELHEIFLESYNYEQAELSAATEGVALEGSQYEAVAEAAINSIFQKIRDFLVKLWNKVKAFFHEVARFLASVFMSGKEFVKKYQKDIEAIDVKDFTYKMFVYNDSDIDAVDKYNKDDLAAELTKEAGDLIKDAEAFEKLSDDAKNETPSQKYDEALTDFEKKAEMEALIKKFSGGKATDAESFDEFLFGLWRKDAKSAEDKDDRDLSTGDVKGFAKVLEASKAASKFSSVQSSSDAAFKKAIAEVDKAAGKFKGSSKAATAASSALRKFSAGLSRYQTLQNKIINSWKTAVKERDAAYKSCIMAAFSNSAKTAKEENK